MKFVALFKRVGLHDRYREIGVVESGDVIGAEQEAVSRLDDGQKRAWFESRLIVKLYDLGGSSNEDHDVLFQEEINALKDEVDQGRLEQMEKPEGGWPRGTQSDRL
jgi:hypothetical protein